MLKLKDLQVQEMKQGKIDVLVLDINEKQTSKGDPYIVCTVTDGDEKAEVKFWNTTKASTEKMIQHVISMGIRCDTYNGAASYLGTTAVFSEKPIEDFIPKVPEDTRKMYQFMYDYPFQDNDLKELVQEILGNNEDKLLYWAAAKSMHHAIYGGLLYHMYRMTQASEMYKSVYGIEGDLITAGAILHDIGKLQELETDPMGTATYTLDGRLFGHLFLGARMVQEAAEKLGTPEELTRHLCHIIVSHHGIQEHGAIVPPATKEAEIVHILDLADARMYEYEDTLKTMEKEEVSDFHRALGHSIVNL